MGRKYTPPPCDHCGAPSKTSYETPSGSVILACHNCVPFWADKPGVNADRGAGS